MKIILVGTPDFSVPTFEKVINNFDVIAIISQPDRKQGRKLTITPTPTKILANKYQIPIFQPVKIIDILDELQKMEFDIFLTMSYGQIIPEKILNLAKKGSLNIHGSLLPKYRGATPAQHAILNGDKETGITLMYMEKKMDSGDILFQSKIKIDENDNTSKLLEKMSQTSSQNIVEWLKKIELGNFTSIKQNENLATYVYKISSEDEELKYDSMEQTLRKIRALSLVPGAYFYDPNKLKRIKIFDAIKEPIKNTVQIPCNDGVLYATHYQIEGKNKVKIK